MQTILMVPSPKDLGCPDTCTVLATFMCMPGRVLQILEPGKKDAEKLWEEVGVGPEQRRYPLLCVRDEKGALQHHMRPSHEDVCVLIGVQTCHATIPRALTSAFIALTSATVIVS